MTTLQGIAASPGIAIGPIHVVDPEEIEVQDGNLAKSAVSGEKERFRTAIRESLDEVRELREKIALETGEEQARILDAQIEILQDPEAQKQTLAVIERERKPAAFAYRRILTAVAARLDEADSEYYRGRAIDVRDVRRRMLAHLGGIRTHTLRDLKEPSLIVASDLPPSEMALLPRNMALGLATDVGGRTSHTAIMARARGIPAVVGVKGATDAAKQGAIGIVDGTRGIAIFDPDPETLADHVRKRGRYLELAAKRVELKDQRCATSDGRVIELGANLEVPEELPSVIENGADGIGLYRTEFFYLSRKQLPTEDAQFNAYRSIVEAMNPKPVNIRTLDVGGDKFASYLGTPIEKNPFLGLRGLRFSLSREEIFRTQLRAIFRASAYGNVRIMFPMVLGLEDLRRAREIVERVRLQLRKEGVAMASKVPLGVMIETPASVFSIDQLTQESDFTSIGTNDLIQYTLAVDRGNEAISEIYEPLHPAVLRAIRTVVDAGHRAGIPVGICGEMAGEPLYTVLLVGLGLEEFSVSPYLVPEIKTIVRATTFAEARELADRCMSLSTPSEVRTVVTEFMSRRYPGIIVPA
ncbi:MAG: phosphoenolpyruvate--protein phosphotransferase [Candidatus Eisenbacteria bacterium]|uniref:Phosphoenolpyruvate-protein phosphotransferase n=2 Tax=Eiseniibacteriota bacterium TaxID=2212470 RepID=A0A538SAN9_UNCEI|nr:MAG: phosphoenolpyruvate--protein phosphotransferase [Candidatus Eisenbacteria bacterium]